MARPRQRAFRVKLVESAGTDREAVARALQTWAILLADHAQRLVVTELRQQPKLKSQDYDRPSGLIHTDEQHALGRPK